VDVGLFKNILGYYPIGCLRIKPRFAWQAAWMIAQGSKQRFISCAVDDRNRHYASIGFWHIAAIEYVF